MPKTAATFGLEVFAAGCGCAVADSTFHPLETFKVRQQASPRPLVDIAREARAEAGVLRGLVAAGLRADALPRVHLATYDTAKRSFKERLGFAEGVPLHVCCSLLSGFVAQLVIQPVDTVKTLVMDSSSAESSPARFARLTRERGVLALYRGLLPALMRQGPVMLVQLPLTEQIRRVFGYFKIMASSAEKKTNQHAIIVRK
ncbi:thiosulfate transmembrane transporter [Aureococcus anophagefferens]|nr:thiosulfate transmembrane transporter [Aureococcus anophagefferens]